MEWKAAIKEHPKRILAAGIAVVVVAGVAVLNPAAAFGKSSSDEAQAVYKETPVQRGDRTVGVSESGTASLEAIAVTYDDYSDSSSSDSNTTVKALLEEVYVKAGQRVAVGDPMGSLWLSDIGRGAARSI